MDQLIVAPKRSNITLIKSNNINIKNDKLAESNKAAANKLLYLLIANGKQSASTG